MPTALAGLRRGFLMGLHHSASISAACALATLAVAPELVARIERLPLPELVSRADGAVLGRIERVEVQRLDDASDGPDLFSITLFVLRRSIEADDGAGAQQIHAVLDPHMKPQLASSLGGTTGSWDGAFTLGWRAWLAAKPAALGDPLAAGNESQAQLWHRDPAAPKSTHLSSGLEFTARP